MNELPNDELLSAYLDGELSAADRAAVERRLAESPDSRQLLEELRAIGAGVRALPRHRLDADFGQRVLRRAERQMLVDPVASASQPAGSPFAAEDGRPRLASAATTANGAASNSPHDRRRLWPMVLWPCAALAAAAALLVAVDPFGIRQSAEHQLAGVNFDRATDMPAPAAATPTEGQDFERLARRQAPRSGGVDRSFGADGAEYFAKSQAGAAPAGVTQTPGGIGGGGVGGAAGAYGNAVLNEPTLLVMLDVREGADAQAAISNLFADANIQLLDERGSESALGRSSSGRHRFAESLANDEMDRGEATPGESTARDNRESTTRESDAASDKGVGDERGAGIVGKADHDGETDNAPANRPADKLAMAAGDLPDDVWDAAGEELYFEVEATPDQLQALIRDAQSQTAWFAASELALTGSGAADAAFDSLSTAHLGALPGGGRAEGADMPAANEPAGVDVPAVAGAAIEPPPSPPLPAAPLSATLSEEDLPVPPPAPTEEARSKLPKGEARPTPDAPAEPMPSGPKAPRSDPAPALADGAEKDSGLRDRSRRMAVRQGGGAAKKAEKPTEKRLSATALDPRGELNQQSSEVADFKRDSTPMGGARRLADLPESLRGRMLYRAPAVRKEAAGAPSAEAAELHDANAANEAFNFIDTLPVREDLTEAAGDIVSTTARPDPPPPGAVSSNAVSSNAVSSNAVPSDAVLPDAIPPDAAWPEEAPPSAVTLEMGEPEALTAAGAEQAQAAPATVRAIIVFRVPPRPIAAESRDESKASPVEPAAPANP